MDDKKKLYNMILLMLKRRMKKETEETKQEKEVREQWKQTCEKNCFSQSQNKKYLVISQKENESNLKLW